MPKLIIFAGLPGTGKTTLARKLSKQLYYFYLREDSIEAPFATVNPVAGEKGEGYEALINLAYENLCLGHSVIIDTVNPLHISRMMFKELGDRTQSHTIQFELTIKDKEIHKSRIDKRASDIASLRMPAWTDVLDRTYEKWDDEIDGHHYEIPTDDMEAALQRCLDIIAAQSKTHH